MLPKVWENSVISLEPELDMGGSIYPDPIQSNPIWMFTTYIRSNP